MFRSDIWVAAFIRRHNDLGRACVLVRRGDPIAGQIFIEVDHLDGTRSLYIPAPARADNDADRHFQLRFNRAPPADVAARIVRETDFDPDLWVVSLDLRHGDPGILVA